MAYAPRQRKYKVRWKIAVPLILLVALVLYAVAPSPNPTPSLQRLSKSPGKAGGLKRGDRSKRFLLFAYGELQQLKLLRSPVLFFLISYVEPNFPLSHSYRAYEIASGPEALSCYFTNFSKASRDFNGTFPFQIAYYLRHPILGRNRQQHMHIIRT